MSDILNNKFFSTDEDIVLAPGRGLIVELLGNPGSELFTCVKSLDSRDGLIYIETSEDGEDYSFGSSLDLVALGVISGMGDLAANPFTRISSDVEVRIRIVGLLETSVREIEYTFDPEQLPQ